MNEKTDLKPLSELTHKELAGIKAYKEYDEWLYKHKIPAQAESVLGMARFAAKNGVRVNEMIAMKDYVKPCNRDIVRRRNPYLNNKKKTND